MPLIVENIPCHGKEKGEGREKIGKAEREEEEK